MSLAARFTMWMRAWTRGLMILQARVPVLADDTAETLHARIQVEEHRLYPEAIRKVAGLGTLDAIATRHATEVAYLFFEYLNTFYHG